MTAHAIAVDVGGTEMKGALVAIGEGGAEPLRQMRRRTPRGTSEVSTADAVVGVVAEMVADLENDAEGDAEAVGVVVPGILDERRGIGVYSVEPPWRDEPLRDKLAKTIDLPLTLGHDVRACGLAEARLGAARGFRDVAVLPIGTGIAAALVLDGRLYAGHGGVGEIGHVDVGHDEPCGCGATGCLEAIASSAAIARRYSARTDKPVDSAMEVTAALRAGDPDAKEVWADAIDGLARAIVLLCAVVSPEALVLGGGHANAGRLLTEPLGARLDDLISIHRRPRIELAQLGDTAGCLGAALLATEGQETR